MDVSETRGKKRRRNEKRWLDKMVRGRFEMMERYKRKVL